MLRWVAAGIAATLALASVADDRAISWPEGQVAAVSLSYDDALESQLDNAIPALDRHGFKASFYLTLANPPLRARMSDWRAAAANGHELANHTIFHGCDALGGERTWVPDHLDVSKRSVADLVDEVEMANTILQALDGRTERTFTPPCGDDYASGENYVDAVADRFVAIKTRDEGMPTGMSVIETPVEMTGPELIELLESHTKQGMLINILFHGIGGDHLAVTSEAHDQLLAYLSEHRDIYWTATYIEIMKHVQAGE